MSIYAKDADNVDDYLSKPIIQYVLSEFRILLAKDQDIPDGFADLWGALNHLNSMEKS